MSHRPIKAKKVAKLRKAIARHPLPASVDLVDWLKLHGYASTTGQAEAILLSGRVRSESHVLGRKQIPMLEGVKIVMTDVVDRYAPSRVRSTIMVLDEKSA